MAFDKPQSRNEAILQNMLGANNELEPPKSRVEALLQELSGKMPEANPSEGTTTGTLERLKIGDDIYTVEGGGSGTSDYDALNNKPQIGGVTLSGNKSLSDLGAQEKLTAGMYININSGTISVKRDVSEDVDEILTLTQDGYNLIATLSIDGTVIESETFTQAGGTFVDLIAIDFNVRSVRWHYTYLKASKNHEVGYDDYIYSSPYTDTFVVTIGKENKLIIKSELDDAMSTKQDTLTFDDVPTENSNNPVKSGGVKSAIDAAVSRCYHHAGTKTCVELVAGLLVAANEGNVYNMTDSGTTTADFIEGAGQPIKAGDNVGIAKISDGVYKFDLLSGFVDTTNFVQKSETAGLLKNDGTVDTTIQGDVSTLKSGLTNLDNEVNGDATVYPYADVITIEDAVPSNLADCKVKIEPVQDLHGQSAPYVGGAGKNKLPMTVDGVKASNTIGTWSGNAYTHNGVTFTVLTDSNGNVTGINADGTATNGNAALYLSIKPNIEADTTYIMNGCPSGGGDSTYNIQYSNFVDNVFQDNGNGINITKFDYTTYPNSAVVIRIMNGYNVQNKIFYPMIRLATETDATFAPYTNICPITGHTEASVQRDGVNMWNGDVFKSGKAIDNTGAEISANNYSLFKYVLPVGNYTVSFADTDKTSEVKIARVGVFNSDDSVANVVSTNTYTSESGRLSLSFSVTDKTQYAIVSLRAVSVVDVQLELGQTATPYEPYAGKTYAIQLGDTIYGGTLRIDSNGNTVMAVDRAYYKFNGTEDWIGSSSKSGSFYKAWSDFIPNGKVNNEFSCSHAIYNSDLSTYKYGECYSDNSCSLFLGTDSMSRDDFKAWILGQYNNGTPVEICYKLATPFTIQLTPRQIQLLKGTNTLTASTGQISVTVNGVSGAIGAVQEQVNDTDETLTELAADIAEQLPTAPTTDGAYVLTVTVADGTPTYSWVSTT